MKVHQVPWSVITQSDLQNSGSDNPTRFNMGLHEATDAISEFNVPLDT